MTAEEHGMTAGPSTPVYRVPITSDAPFTVRNSGTVTATVILSLFGPPARPVARTYALGTIPPQGILPVVPQSLPRLEAGESRAGEVLSDQPIALVGA